MSSRQSNTNKQKQALPTWRYLWQIVTFRPWLYAGASALRILIFCVAPQATGLLLRSFFNELTGNAPVQIGIWAISALIVAIALARAAAIFGDITVHFRFLFTGGALLRKNLFEYILDRPAAQAIQSSAGEAISRFREDVNEAVNIMGELPFMFGFGAFTIIALAVMLQVNTVITLVVCLPLVGVIILANRAVKNIEKLREASRKATGNVTGFIGEMFGAVQAIKVASAEDRLTGRFAELNEVRRKTTLRDRLFNELFRSFFYNAINLGTGLLLVSAAQSMRQGTFTVGDFALFVYYLGFITELSGQIGWFWAWYKQVGVSVRRMNKLLEGAPEGALTRHSQVYMSGDLPEIPYTEKTPADRLDEVEAHNLSYHYPVAANPDSAVQVNADDSHGKGIKGVNLHIRRGSFTVITGRIGSGKTTLIRVLLGLLPRESGEIRWNGKRVEDPASFFTPPRSAYTAQVPLLFQETVRDNILMGLPVNRVDLDGAVRRAVLEQDLAELDHGLDTLIGAKGVKVSGGQRQRIAAARMFVRDPELLVFDDLSSALDVETEQSLWERVFEQKGATCLVVSHRRPALRRADHIIVLKDGTVAAEGKLEDLLRDCEEMQHLWQGDLK